MAGTLLQGTSKIQALSGPLKDVSLSTTSKTLTLAPRSLFPALSLSTTGKTLNLCRSVESSAAAAAAAAVKNKDKDNKSRSWSDLVEQVNELVDWFEKETMEAIKIAQILRSDYNILAHKLQLDEYGFSDENEEEEEPEQENEEEEEPEQEDEEEEEPEPDALLVDKLKEMFCNLESIQHMSLVLKDKDDLKDEYLRVLSRKASFRRIPSGKKDVSIKLSMYRLALNQLLNWFDKNLLETKKMTLKLRTNYQMIAQKLLDNVAEEEEKGVLLADLEKMFWDLSEKQSRGIQAKSTVGNEVEHAAKASALLYCFFVR